MSSKERIQIKGEDLQIEVDASTDQQYVEICGLKIRLAKPYI